MPDLTQRLLDLQMSDKEASVYMSMLELGPSSVQDIAKHAGVNRATTYVMLEALKRRGLVSSVDRGKKVHFAAESPEHLLHGVQDEVRVAQDKFSRLKSAMPEFLALFTAMGEKPKVRFFEGEEGVNACREAMLELAKEGQLWRQFIALTKEMAEMNKKFASEREKLGTGKYSFRALVTAESGVEIQPAGKNFELRHIPANILPFQGEFDIYDNFIVVLTPGAKPISVIIESESVAKLFQSFFDLAWQGAAASKI